MPDIWRVLDAIAVSRSMVEHGMWIARSILFIALMNCPSHPLAGSRRSSLFQTSEDILERLKNKDSCHHGKP